jgi:hypothetical protein
MPNWAIATLKITGEPENIEEFCKLFIYTEDEGKEKESYFARSFTETSWNDFKQEYLHGESEIHFGAQFAWSAYTCLIEGYPNGLQCITLKQACKKHKVSVWINTEEIGEGFEEKIYCSKLGLLKESCKLIPEYRCECGNEQWIESSVEIEEQDCWTCSKTGKWIAKLNRKTGKWFDLKKRRVIEVENE